MTMTFGPIAIHIALACQELVTRSSSPSPPSGDGYLHVLGLHVPALAAMFLTAPIVWFAAEAVHRAERRRRR
jgi:hypothetical protein